jgi:hypothetical protein
MIRKQTQYLSSRFLHKANFKCIRWREGTLNKKYRSKEANLFHGNITRHKYFCKIIINVIFSRDKEGSGTFSYKISSFGYTFKIYNFKSVENVAKFKPSKPVKYIKIIRY